MSIAATEGFVKGAKTTLYSMYPEIRFFADFLLLELLKGARAIWLACWDLIMPGGNILRFLTCIFWQNKTGTEMIKLWLSYNTTCWSSHDMHVGVTIMVDPTQRVPSCSHRTKHKCFRFVFIFSLSGVKQRDLMVEAWFSSVLCYHRLVPGPQSMAWTSR